MSDVVVDSTLEPVAPAGDSGDTNQSGYVEPGWEDFSRAMESDEEESAKFMEKALQNNQPPPPPAQQAQTPPAPPVAPAAPDTSAPAPTPAPAAPVEAQAPAAPQQQPPAPQPQPAPVPALQLSAEQLQQMQQQYIEQLMPQYRLSDDDAGKVALSPNEVLPRLAAQLHANISQQVTRDIVNSLMSQLPNVILTTVEKQSASTKAEADFFTKWPELKEFRDEVMAYGKVWRAHNAGASLDAFIKDVGVAVWMKKGLPVATLASRMNGTPSPAPAAQPLQIAPAPQRQAGYQPATPASRTPPPPPPNPNDNPWGNLAVEIKESFF